MNWAIDWRASGPCVSNAGNIEIPELAKRYDERGICLAVSSKDVFWRDVVEKV